MQAIKCMIIGDSQVGKTDLFSTLTTGSPASSYAPTVFDTCTKEVTVDDQKYNLGLWDSAGDKLYDEIRPISYPHTDCFIICYSVDNRESYENVENKWKPEILRFGDGPEVPVILAGMKSDFRTTNPESTLVTLEEGEDLKSRIAAAYFFEISTKTIEGVDELLTKAIDAAILKKTKEDQPANPIWGFEDLKILVVGDSTVGKSSILNAYSSRKPISETHQPTTEVIPHYHDIVLEGIEYFLGIYDLPSQSEFLHDRLQEYEKADGIILCYAVNDPFSFQNVELQWLPEIRACCPQVPVILVGNKKDLVNDSGILIPTVDGEELMLSIGACAFVECSAKTLENIQDIYISAAQAFKKTQQYSPSE